MVYVRAPRAEAERVLRYYTGDEAQSEILLSPKPAIWSKALSSPSGRVSWLEWARHTNKWLHVGNFFLNPAFFPPCSFRFFPIELPTYNRIKVTHQYLQLSPVTLLGFKVMLTLATVEYIAPELDVSWALRPANDDVGCRALSGKIPKNFR